MTSYLSYETEKREIRMVPVNVIDFKSSSISTNNMNIREFTSSFKLSFFNETEAYQLLQFFEIEQSEINWKYIKQDLSLYHKDMKYDFRGCFSRTISFEMNFQEIEINYDYFESHPMVEEDKLILLSQTRNQKLKSLGI